MRRGEGHNGYSALIRQLAVAVRRGLPAQEVTSVLSEDTELETKAREGLAKLGAALAAGDSIPAAMEKIPRVFAPETVRWMRVAEQSGGLATALEALAADLGRQDTEARTVRLALIWPLAVSWAMIAVFGVVGLFVMPAFKELFEGFGVELPRLTRITFAGSGLLFGLPVLALLLVLGLAQFRLPAAISDPIDNALDALSFFRRFRRARFASRLIDLLRAYCGNGEVLAASIAHLGATAEAPSLSNAASRLRTAIASGTSLSQALAGEPALPRRFSLYAQLGEKMHDLPAALSDLSEMAEIELRERPCASSAARSW